MNKNSGNGILLREQVFRNNGTYVSYPLVVSSDMAVKTDALNDIILGDINKILNLYSADAFLPPAGGPDVFLRDTLNIRYEIMRNDNNYLSIFYTADFYSPYGAYPTQTVYTTNIDLQNVRRIRLQDLNEVDNTLINEFLSWEPVNINPQYMAGIRDYIRGLGTGIVQRGFASADIIGSDNFLGIFSYLKPGRLGISISLPNYLGNHAEFEKVLNANA